MQTLKPEIRKELTTRIDAMINAFNIDVRYQLFVSPEHTTLLCDYDPSIQLIRCNVFMCARHAHKLGIDLYDYVTYCMAHELGHHLTDGIVEAQITLTALQCAMVDTEVDPHHALSTLELCFPEIYKYEVVAWDISEKLHGRASDPTYQSLRTVCLNSYMSFYTKKKEQLEEQVASKKAVSGMRSIVQRMVARVMK